MKINYIPFTKQEREQARRTDLVELLRNQGETLKHSGSEYEWKDGSQKVTIRGHLWYHQYEQAGGDAVDFICKYYRKNYTEAVQYLLGHSTGVIVSSLPQPKANSEPNSMSLPYPNKNMKRVYAYLIKHRGICRDVIYEFIQWKMLYESEKYHNVVFVGYDQDGVPRHANMRGTGSESTFKGNIPNGQPEYSFHWTGTSRYLCLFEAPVDMLSFISMHKENWRSHSYAACCGVSDRVLWQMMKDNPQIDSVYLCLDNDEAGHKANKRISDALFVKGIKHEILIPNRKDWNEDLLYPLDEQEEDECQALQL